MYRVQLHRPAAAAAAFLAVAGCGSISTAVSTFTGEHAYKLFTRAKSAATTATSVHMTGHFTVNGKPAAI